MKTEDALTKWCPFARVATYTHAYSEGGTEINDGMSCNRGDPKEMWESANCVADKCMLWIPYPKEFGLGGRCGMMLHGSVIDANTG